MSILRTAAALLVSGLALAGCASSASAPSAGSPSSTAAPAATASASPMPSSPTSAAAPAAVSVSIKGFAYTVPASVSPGATVTVVNEDSEAHTVTSDTAGAFTDAAGAGSTTTFTAPSKPGRYPFHCKYHDGMHAVLIVA